MKRLGLLVTAVVFVVAVGYGDDDDAASSRVTPASPPEITPTRRVPTAAAGAETLLTEFSLRLAYSACDAREARAVEALDKKRARVY